MQRTILGLTGAAAGAGINSSGEAAPDAPVQPIAPQNGHPVNPGYQHPFVHPVPAELQPIEQQQAQKPAAAPAVPQAKGQQAAGNHQKGILERKDKGSRAAVGAVFGAVAGVGVHLLASVNSKKNAEAGATQNDEERVKWERQRQIREEMDRRNYGRDRDC